MFCKYSEERTAMWTYPSRSQCSACVTDPGGGMGYCPGNFWVGICFWVIETPYPVLDHVQLHLVILF